MIVYKVYHNETFEKAHLEYFQSLLDVVKQGNFLSPNLDEIIITDELEEEIKRYCAKRDYQPNITKSREYATVAKIIDFEGKKKIFLDVRNINGSVELTPQIFFQQIIEVYAEDIVANNYEIVSQFHSTTPLGEIVKICFSQWAIKVVSNLAEKYLNIPHENILTDVKMFVDSFKRKIRKLHYEYQKDADLHTFWTKAVLEVDNFIRRCLDVKYDEGSFLNLQEFNSVIPDMLTEIELQTQNLLDKKEIIFNRITEHFQVILTACSITITDPDILDIQITETPKKIFKNIVDTEPRIVAFFDILGFSAIIEEYDSDERSNILNELHDTLEGAIKISIENMTDPKIKTDLNEFLEYRMFSDCICISLPYIEWGNDFHIQFHSLSTIAKAYQLTMMQKGFFVRGGISMGSFYSDKNMIFSGALVKAYKLEQSASNPVIAIDDDIIERLKQNYAEHSKGLFYGNIILYADIKPEIKFLNPFDFLDNSQKYFDYLLTTIDDLNESEESKDDPFANIANSVIKMATNFSKPIFEYAKTMMNPESITKQKKYILDIINEKINNCKKLISLTEDPEKIKHQERILGKYEFLKNLILWTMGDADTSSFAYISLE